MTETFDVIVIGAGAAGLAAASHLNRHGKSVCILEARTRIGGRVFSVRTPGSPLPFELGAEFIHGESPSVLEQVRISGDVAIDSSHTRAIVKSGRLQEADSQFETMKKSFERLPKPKTDLSLADFLDKHKSRVSPSVRTFAKMLVEGFDAADSTRVSAFSILKEWSGGAAADAPTFRPHRGYGALLDSLVASFDPQRVRLQTNCVVSEVRWQRGEVTVVATRHGEPIEIRASQAIVTLPISVLQLPPQARGAVQFTPALPRRQLPLSRIAMGPVIKMVMLFSKPFWAEIQDKQFRDTAFFHCSDATFPTFWTTLPARTSMISAWSGGPRTARLVGRSTDEVLDVAIESLGSIFGKKLPYRRMLEAVHWHDWQSDPFSGGAYSYSLVGAANARKLLGRPIEDTLFFAGEALDEKEPASVGGAMNTGQVAAKQALES